jgi:glutamate synthase (NADPH/NADH) large chain
MIVGERYHTEFLEAVPFAEVPSERQAELKALIEEHTKLAHSQLGEELLESWADESQKFVLFVPKPQA